MAEITAKLIQKYSKYTRDQLIIKAVDHFHLFIRTRDADQPCISCGSWSKLQAGHYYAAGHHSELRFDERNVNGQCLRCNHFLSGNQTEYRKGLIKKIGLAEVEKLDMIVARAKQTGATLDRIKLIEIIEKYK